LRAPGKWGVLGSRQYRDSVAQTKPPQIPVAYGAGNDPIETLLDILGTLGDNANVGLVSSGFAEEDGFPLVRFDQGDVAVGAGDGDNKTGKACPGTDIGDSAAVKMGGEEKGFTIMPLDGFFKAIDPSQV
jgi:hypothetical protein